MTLLATQLVGMLWYPGRAGRAAVGASDADCLVLSADLVNLYPALPLEALLALPALVALAILYKQTCRPVERCRPYSGPTSLHRSFAARF